MTHVDDIMLMAYVDGELDAATAREIEVAISADPLLGGRVRHMRDSAMFARAAYAEVLNEAVPDRLVAALRKPTSNVLPFPSRKAVMRFAAWAAAATVLFGIGISSWYMDGELPAPSGLQLATAASDRWLDHVAGFYNVYATALAKEERLLVDFNAEDIPELEKWFGARLQRKLAVPDLSSRGFTTQGGRILIIDGRPAAQFLYFADPGELVGIVIAFSKWNDQAARLLRRKDLNIVHWRKAGYAYAIVSTIDADRLMEMATFIGHELDPI
ncbi:MAG: anti-sigma factor [Proteobacteria bacterium]|nr:anti-sigma factor [Pseudomonadota bacterium]